MELDLRDRDPSEGYRFLTGAVVPRPIGWISTRSPEGADNLAPYSFFNAVSSSPPVVMFSAGRSGGRRKDTPTNAIDSGEFVWNLVTEPLAEAMDRTSETIDPDESEFDLAGVERARSVVVDAPRVANADVSFECRLHDWIEIHDYTVVFGDVHYVHADDAVLTDGTIDARKINAVARLGGPHYATIDVMDVQRGH